MPMARYTDPRASGAQRQRPRLPVKSYTNTEWEAKRPIITNLYSVKRLPLAEVRQRLRHMGFLVNERMLHTRIRSWKLGRNHKASEMRSAAHLLAEHLGQSHTSGQDADSQANRKPISFLIRGEEVSHAEFLRYFRRKKISDPISWVKELVNGDKVSTEDVQLITGTVTPPSDSEDNVEPEIPTAERDVVIGDNQEQLHIQRTEEIDDLLNQTLYEDIPDRDRSQRLQTVAQSYYPTHLSESVHLLQTSTSASPSFLFRPQTFHALEHLNYSMSTYITSYTSSARSLKHVEPTVHAYTVHAVFASKMADGMALLSRISRGSTITTPTSSKQHHKGIQSTDQSPAQAFENFQNAFELIRPILSNDHPMSLSLLLSTICELISHTDDRRPNSSTESPVPLFWTVTAQLVHYIRDMASLMLGNGHALTTFFAVLAQQTVQHDLSNSTCPSLSTTKYTASQVTLDLANLITTTLRVATSQYISTSPDSAHDWKTMYLRERFCDSLYHSGPVFAHERVQQRRLLLGDQERFYGPAARNVLYTLTNVADDALENGDVDTAIGHFQEVLRRAEMLTDYGRAKTRFVALEGLGKCFMAKAGTEAEKQSQTSATTDGLSMSTSTSNIAAQTDMQPLGWIDMVAGLDLDLQAEEMVAGDMANMGWQRGAESDAQMQTPVGLGGMGHEAFDQQVQTSSPCVWSAHLDDNLSLTQEEVHQCWEIQNSSSQVESGGSGTNDEIEAVNPLSYNISNSISNSNSISQSGSSSPLVPDSNMAEKCFPPAPSCELSRRMVWGEQQHRNRHSYTVDFKLEQFFLFTSEFTFGVID